MGRNILESSDLLTSGEAAKYLGFSVRSISKWADQKLIKAAHVTPGGYRRFTKAELDRFAATLQGNGDAA